MAYVLRGYRGDVGDALSRAVSGNRVASHHEDGRQCKEPHARYGERKGCVRLTSGSAHVCWLASTVGTGAKRRPRGLKSTPPPCVTTFLSAVALAERAAALGVAMEPDDDDEDYESDETWESDLDSEAEIAEIMQLDIAEDTANTGKKEYLAK